MRKTAKSRARTLGRGFAVAFGNLPSETAGGFCGASQGERSTTKEARRDVSEITKRSKTKPTVGTTAGFVLRSGVQPPYISESFLRRA